MESMHGRFSKETVITMQAQTLPRRRQSWRALGLKLAGDAWYFGKRYEKPTIGDDVRPIESYDIVRANRLLYTTALVAMMVFSGAVLLIKRIMMAL